MRSRAILVAVAAASALLVLTGCVAHVVVPAPPSLKDVTAYNQKVLDATWKADGLADLVPKLSTSEHLATAGDLSGAFDCLAAAGFPGASIGSDGKSYSLASGSNDTDSDAQPADEKIALYTCLAEYPPDPRRGDAGQALYSAAQLRYLWKYFTTWQIPCLELHGYTITDVPTRARFLAESGSLWTPYSAVQVASSDTTLTDDFDRQMKQLRTMCGATLGVIAPNR